LCGCRRRRVRSLREARVGRDVFGLQLVASQASVAAIVGTLVGVPVGIATGRWLWILFAHSISAVLQPTVPALPIILVAVGGLILANLVAAIPGRQAARTPSALVLRAE
jgi:ABC-type lipoprotein release transport system permease subunit